MPTINRPTGRQALCLTTIITVAGTVLPPGQTAAMLAADSDLTIAALPAAYRPLLLCLQLNRYLAALLLFCNATCGVLQTLILTSQLGFSIPGMENRN